MKKKGDSTFEGVVRGPRFGDEQKNSGGLIFYL